MTDLLHQLENIGIIEFTILSQYCLKNYWQQSCWQLKHQIYKREPEPVIWRDDQLCYYGDVPVICCLIITYYGELHRLFELTDQIKKFEPSLEITSLHRIHPEITTVSIQVKSSPMQKWLGQLLLSMSI